MGNIQNFWETMILMLIKEFHNAVHFEICLLESVCVVCLNKNSRDSVPQFTS